MSDFTTSSQGDRIAYDLRGSGPAVIFVAGAGPFRAIDPMTTATATLMADEGVTTLVFDRLGRGESPADGVLDLERELDAIRALIDVVGGSAVLCGHSSGCSIALKAVDAGLPVTGVALYEAPLAQTAVDTRMWAVEIERRIDAGDFTGATEHYMKDMPPEWLDGIKASPEWVHVAAGIVSQRADAQSLDWAQTALENGDIKRIDVPVLAMYGVDTFPEMPVAAAALAAAIPDAQEKEVPGAQHFWDPEAMAAELVAFVQRCTKA